MNDCVITCLSTQFTQPDDEVVGQIDLSDKLEKPMYQPWKGPVGVRDGPGRPVRGSSLVHTGRRQGLDLSPDALYMELTGLTADEMLEHRESNHPAVSGSGAADVGQSRSVGETAVQAPLALGIRPVPAMTPVPILCPILVGTFLLLDGCLLAHFASPPCRRHL